MAENEERVDFDEENYMEEIDDDVEEHLDGTRGREEEDEDEESENPRTVDSEKDQLSEDDGAHLAIEPEENEDNEENAAFSVNDEEKEKHAKLLALPPHGAEIFIGGLPRDTLEGDLRDHFESIGDILEVRLIKNKDTNESKGYAFMSFSTKDAAQKAVEELHNKEFKGKAIRCSLSDAKYRLFIGNVPKSLTYENFKKIVEQTGPGAENIELIKDPLNPSRNRGFAFVEYYNNACADYSRLKMTNADFKIDGLTPTITWADPKITSENSPAASQVKALYVKNIPDNTTTEQVKELFQRHGEVTKVVMPPSKSGSTKRDFGFVHFAERSSAMKAVKEIEKYEINGQVLEVALAKPQSDKKPEASFSHNSGILPKFPPHPGYGSFAANPYGGMGAGYGVAQQQPMIYGRGPMPAGMQMVPMVLPDGQIGYVLQQPGMQMAPPPQISRRNDWSGSHGGRGGDNNRGRRYRPY